MDTQLSVNNDLVSKIKREALSLGIFEAYLEAAPQLIFQLSLVLRTGYVSCKIFTFFANKSLAILSLYI